jgi:hypothetical protein
MHTPDLLKAYYGEIEAAAIQFDEKTTPSIHSYSPYIKKLTYLVAFNFLRINYNLRDPVLIKIWINGGGKLIRIFSPNEVLILTPEELDALNDNNIQYGNVHIEIFHPQIKTPNSEFRFFTIYHSPSHSSAGVHSLGAMNLVDLGSNLGSRSILPIAESTFAHNPDQCIEITRPKNKEFLAQADPINSSHNGPGFFSSIHDMQVRGVWHDSDLYHAVKRAKDPIKLCPLRQSFPIVNFPESSPLIWISKDQIGYLPKKLSISIFNKHNLELRKDEFVIEGNKTYINLRDFYKNESKQKYVYAIANFDADQGDFDSPALGYLHLYYQNKNKISDQVHSQITPSFWTDTTKSLVPYRCRKFAPWINHSSQDWHYAIVNIGGNGANKDEEIRFRIFTSDNKERVIDKQLLNETVSFFHGASLLKELGLSDTKAAIFQIESETSNFNAFWVLEDKESQSIGIDHFTGG